MKTAAVIAEYNPFHRGHEYQLRRIRQDSGADYIVIMMSGDFVQRGAPAIIDKYQRTRMALLCGADLVLELPLPASIGSSRDFADGAVALLDRLGVVDELWFGSECGDIGALMKIARVLTEEPDDYRRVLRESLAAGMAYPAAQEKGVETVLDLPGLHEILSSPNDLLALAYLIALEKRNSSMTPCAIRRVGADYHGREKLSAKSESCVLDTASAESIREKLMEGRVDDACRAMPPAAAEILRESAERGEFLCQDDFSAALNYQLEKESADSLADYAGVSPDLANRILKYRYRNFRFSDLSEALKARNVTKTRVDRALFSILFGVKKNEEQRSAENRFVRMLGCRKDASELLGAVGRMGQIQVIGKGSSIPGKLYEKDFFASNLYETYRAEKSGTEFVHECSRKLITL